MRSLASLRLLLSLLVLFSPVPRAQGVGPNPEDDKDAQAEAPTGILCAAAGIPVTVIRACAGGALPYVPDDEVHAVDITLQLLKEGTPLQASAKIALTFSYLPQIAPLGTPAQITKDGVDITGQIITTNAQGQVAVKVVSSQQICNPSLVIQHNGTAEIGRLSCNFAAVESKRLWGIKSFNQTYALDTGWQFDVVRGWEQERDGSTGIVFTKPNQVMACNLYLRFRRDLDEAKVDKNYFMLIVEPHTPQLSVDLNNDGNLSDYEWNAVESRGSEQQPLETGTDGAPLWKRVANHLVRIRLQGSSIPNDMCTIEAADLSTRLVAFSNEHGSRVQDNPNDLGTWMAEAENAPLTTTLTVRADSAGKALFYLLSGALINRTTRLDLRAEDITQLHGP